MNKCMWKPNTGNETIPRGVLPMERKQKKYIIQSNIKTLMEKDCEVGKIRIFEEIFIYL